MPVDGGRCEVDTDNFDEGNNEEVEKKYSDTSIFFWLGILKEGGEVDDCCDAGSDDEWNAAEIRKPELRVISERSFGGDYGINEGEKKEGCAKITEGFEGFHPKAK